MVDESVDRGIVDRLREMGEEVVYIAEVEPSIPDDEVLARARDADALLLTADKDFGELVFRRRLVSGGVVLLRLAGLDVDEKASLIEQLVVTQGSKLRGHFTVVAPSGVRIRRIAT